MTTLNTVAFPRANKALLSLAKKLRNCRELPEYQLFQSLNQSGYKGFFFLRQMAIGPFIVDLVCPYLGLVIEISGDGHDLKYEEDGQRYPSLQDMGWKVMTLTNQEIKKDLKGTTQTVFEKIDFLLGK